MRWQWTPTDSYYCLSLSFHRYLAAQKLLALAPPTHSPLNSALPLVIMIFTTFFSVLLLATASIAAPVVTPISDDVVSPHITAPEEAVSWPMGSTQVVKWDTDMIPADQRNDQGLILLGYAGNGDSEHLDIKNPLAKGFPISAGKATVIMPSNVPARKDYFVVLFGDSGNTSPQFKITPVKEN